MKLLLLSILFCTCLFLINCHKPLNCGDTIGVESSALLISIFNTATNNYMYPEDGFLSSFKKDSLEVINEDGRKLNFVSFILEQDPRNSLKRYYAVRIAPAFIIPDDNDAFTKEKTRKIYLKYNFSTADTLTLVFKAYKDKCDKGQYEYLNIYRRGSLISTVGNGPGAVFTLNY